MDAGPLANERGAGRPADAGPTRRGPPSTLHRDRLAADAHGGGLDGAGYIGGGAGAVCDRPLPPRWALGYHQCRWSYEPESRVGEIASEMRQRRIPCDVIWLDIDYMDGFACFTFDDEKFPDPAGLNADLHAEGFKTVWMIDPGIKVDESYAVNTAGREGDHFVRTAGGAEYHGKVWPGPCAFPDFTRSETRTWWADLYEGFIARGLDGVWNDMNEPAIALPQDDFFGNGIDGCALVSSIPVAVNPKGGMNCYWPMPFRKCVRFEISNDGPEAISEFFYQITYAERKVDDDAGYLHACWRRSITTRDNPEHVILDGVKGRGHYVGTYLVWNQCSQGWWGEGEVKFFIDGDRPDAPTICGTGTEDYFGGAWGFVMDDGADARPTTYATAYLGYPQAVFDHDPSAGAGTGPRIASHGLYRWHIPDPVRFEKDLRVTVQALGWQPGQKYQPLTDDIASTALWYQTHPGTALGPLPGFNERYAR